MADETTNDAPAKDEEVVVDGTALTPSQVINQHAAGHNSSLVDWARSPAGKEWQKGEGDRQKAIKAEAKANADAAKDAPDLDVLAEATGKTDSK